MDIAVAGTDSFVTPFRLAGLKRFYTIDTVEDLKSLLPRLLSDKSIGILILYDKEVSSLSVNLRQKLWMSIKPVVISIGSEPEVDIRERIKQAIGVDLYASK
ncbi:MAG: V-type ATP synthase subunit F [Candidatus Thermoplasmatota archaeon]|jgi:vacuolar-type H+-ATPase subunit F/Vma7|nr:V-type ATP synthase subunit F [Candidatus Thermoplasmatota archaeon]